MATVRPAGANEPLTRAASGSTKTEELEAPLAALQRAEYLPVVTPVKEFFESDDIFEWVRRGNLTQIRKIVRNPLTAVDLDKRDGSNQVSGKLLL
jgi:hypothetical protein